MRALLLEATVRAGGVITRREGLAVVDRHVLDKALAAGALRRMFPSVYCLPELVDDIAHRRVGALKYVHESALSHFDALDVWNVWEAPPGPIHLTAREGAAAARQPGLLVHRRRGFALQAPQVVLRKGYPVVALEQAVVETWPLLAAMDRRVPAIVACREKFTDGAGLQATLAANPRVPGAAEMRRVFSLAGAGLHSPLELWGHENVFNVPSLPTAELQVPVDLHDRTVYLDRYYGQEMVAAELDGAAYHGAPGQRERDLIRDADVATRGILTVRFSHQRLHREPERCRGQLREILAVRRRQFGLPAA